MLSPSAGSLLSQQGMKPNLLEYACAVPDAVPRLQGFRACSSWRAVPVLSSRALRGEQLWGDAAERGWAHVCTAGLASAFLLLASFLMM